jgi:hypothetical protein
MLVMRTVRRISTYNLEIKDIVDGFDVPEVKAQSSLHICETSVE